MGELNEFCGICAACTPGRNACPDLYQMMKDLQHRGQAGAGMATYDPDRKRILKTHKRTGTVDEVFGGEDQGGIQDILQEMKGSIGIGHTRYGTSGSLTSRHVQPFERVHGLRGKWFAFGFNGHIANRKDLESRIKDLGYHLMLDTDTEVMMHYFSHHISGTGGELKEVFRRMSLDLDGAYNMAFIDAMGDLVVARDPWGIRPLSSIVTENGSFAASETCALYRQGTEDIHHIEPGEMAILRDGGIEYHRFAERRKRSLCFFEFIYFASVTSNLDGRSVYETRKRCGEELARIETQDINDRDWVVIPVPNTARPIANSFAKALGHPRIYEEGLIAVGKGRTFIDEGDRSAKVRRKFMPIPSVLKGKKVIVIDDSIVRSTTMATIVRYHLKEVGGAKEVHVRIATPPIIAPCYYGIDMRTFDELVASRYEEMITSGIMDEEARSCIAQKINAESLIYLTHEGLLRALGMDRNNLCMACLDRRYPTPAGQELDRVNHEHFSKSLRELPDP
ncbi:MAG: amidophosphoribosyltransferase [Candidatus Thermoplasmatota archaeon]|nr:amidophosphoribosyltransferase [Candidatus Thermoplasmatota archaeon]